MSITTVFEYDDLVNYSFVNALNSAGKGRLALIPNPGQIFSQDFSSDVGFTYDNTKAEFTGGLVRQKDQRQANSVVAATYTSSKNLNWSQGGSLVATDIGTPVLNLGKLDCLGGGNNAVRYENADIGASGNVGAIKIKYTPNYSGTPAANYNIFEFAPVSGNNDRMLLLHSASGGTLRLTAYTSVGTVKHSAAILGAAWSPSAGTEYELELNWDTIAGVVRLFVDGVLQGSVPVSSYARGTDADRLYIGAGTVYTAADGSFNDVLLFSTVQHTTNYTPGYSIAEYIYLGSKADGPNFTYTGVGTILSVDDGSVVETGLPRYIVGGKYWNGSSWVVSNGTYAQANSFATALANLPALDTGGGILPWSVVFTDSNSLSSVDNFSVEVTGEKYSPTGTIEIASALYIQTFLAFSASLTATGTTAIKFAIRVGSQLKYWNGSAWANSDGSSGQTNTAAEVTANIASLVLSNNSLIKIYALLTTGSNIETPELDSTTIEYDFGGVVSAPNFTITYGYIRDHSSNPVVATIRFKPVIRGYADDDNNIITNQTMQATSDANGYFDINLLPGLYEVSYFNDNFSVNKNSSGEKIIITIPDQVSVNVTDQL